MSARVRFGKDTVAELSDAGHWSLVEGDAPGLERVLNAMYGRSGGWRPDGYAASWVEAAALQAAKELGGELVHLDPPGDAPDGALD